MIWMRIEDVRVERRIELSRANGSKFANDVQYDPITESELLTLVADLAERVRWCEEHEQSTESHRFCAEGVITGSKHRCRITERFLLPLGVLVDGPKEER